MEYELDEDGNVNLDENGEPVFNLGKTQAQHVAQMVLWGNDGKPYYAYSVASEKEALVTSLVTAYEAELLSKSEQFKDDPTAQEHIRGIALHGYWGAANEQDEEGNYKTGRRSICRRIKSVVWTRSRRRWRLP